MQIAFSEKNHIFRARNQKKIGPRRKIEFRFKKVSGLFHRAKECVMHSCFIGTPPPHLECILPQSVPPPRPCVGTYSKTTISGREGRLGRGVGVRNLVSAFKPPH